MAQWIVPKMKAEQGAAWIIDDTGIPKMGKHSVGVAGQYCGVLGKQDNCQVAVSISLATEEASVPLAYRLYLPKEWAEDRARRRKAGVPEEIGFATKTQIALEQLEGLIARGATKHCVLADAGYGVDTAFRQRLSDLGLGIEPDYQDLKQELGLDHYEGRMVRLSSPCDAEHCSVRLSDQRTTRCWRIQRHQKNFVVHQVSALPADYVICAAM